MNLSEHLNDNSNIHLFKEKNKLKDLEHHIIKLIYPNINNQIEYSPNEFDSWDAINYTHEHLIELKTRNFSYQYFENKFDSWIIEKDKYDFLMQESKRKNLIPVYGFSFSGNCIYKNKIQGWEIINLKDLNLKDFIHKKMPCPISSYQSKIKMKDCYLIPKKLLNKNNSYIKLYKD